MLIEEQRGGYIISNILNFLLLFLSFFLSLPSLPSSNIVASVFLLLPLYAFHIYDGVCTTSEEGTKPDQPKFSSLSLTHTHIYT